MQFLIDFVLNNLNYWWVFVFMAIESSFIPFPSEVVVPPAAFLAMMDDSHLNIIMVIVVATLGADVGALVNYYLAKWLGRPIVYRFADSRLGHMCLIDRAKVEHAEAFFREHGATSTFFGRLVPAVRQLISIPAGLAGMNVWRFLLFTTLGAGVWNSVLALLGYIIHTQTGATRSPQPLSFGGVRHVGGETTKDVAELASRYSHEIGYVILACAVVVVAFLAYKGLKKSK